MEERGGAGRGGGGRGWRTRGVYDAVLATEIAAGWSGLVFAEMGGGEGKRISS